jgi:hypothetical protein
MQVNEITTIATIVTTASVLIGVIFTILELLHLSKARKTDIIMRIYDRFSTKETVESMNKVGNAKFASLKEYQEKYGFVEAVEIASLFEGIGVLLEQKLIDIKMVDTLFGPTLNMLWRNMETVIQWMREGMKEPFFFSHYEYLITKLNEYRKSK